MEEKFRRRIGGSIRVLKGRLKSTRGGDEIAKITERIEGLEKQFIWQPKPKTAGLGTVGQATREASRDHGRRKRR